MATAIPFEMVFQTTSGVPVSGVKVYVYAPTTTTPRTAYSDTALSVPIANPFVGDSAGYVAFYLSSDLGYRIVAKSADDSITYYDQEHPSNAAGSQPVDAVLTSLSGLSLTSGDIIEATSATALRTRKFQVGTYADLRALSGLTVGDAVYVNGRASLRDGGEGWGTVAASGTDNDGITLVMADSKAWIRNDIQESVDADWFGIIPGAVTLSDYNDMVATVALQNTRTTELRGGTYTFATAPDAMETIMRLRGQGLSITTLERSYSEGGGDTVAFLEFRNALASNSGLEDLQIRPASGTTGGTMLKIYAEADEITSWMDMRNCVITPNSGNYIWGLIVDGILNDVSGSQGVRNFRTENCFIFAGSTDKCAAFYNSTNGHHSGLWCNGDILISGGGSALTNTTNFRMTGLVCLGELTLENCTEVHISGTMEDIVIAATATNVTIMGDCGNLTIAAGATGTFTGRIRGTLTNNAPTTFAAYSDTGLNGSAAHYGLMELGRATVNMNVTTDQALTIRLPPGFTRYAPQTGFVANNSSANLATAAGGIYTDASKAGTQIVASSQVYTSITGANKRQTLTVSTAGLDLQTDTTLFFSLTTAAGVAGTAELVLIGYVFT